MPSLLTTPVAANYLKNVKANGLGPRTVIVSVSKNNITDTELNAVIGVLTSAGGDPGYNEPDFNGPDAFVVAGLSGDETVTVGDVTKTLQFVSGVTDVVYLALQGTGTPATGSNVGVTGATVAVVASFDQNYE
jgi:hypothetical protein